ncbi:MAG: 30S ribosomal protein S20 [Candidatus Omnitrophica bacterium]|nr:30S ribosomal protein S20 [Candidatus Omnitrophota bacterium]
MRQSRRNPRMRLKAVIPPMIPATLKSRDEGWGVEDGGEVDKGESAVLGSIAMPIIHSAEKRVRADRKRRQRNLQLASEMKTLTRKFLAFTEAAQAEQARSVFQSLIKRLDQAAGKQVIHRNTASRRKSRLARRLAKLR